MLWGQGINVYTDHKNLTRDSLGLTSDRVARWRILLEECAPEIIYIKGINNTVADAISRLDYDPKLNSLTAKSCYGGEKHLNPVGFYNRNSTKSTLQHKHNNHKHHHHGGAVCPSYGLGSMDPPNLRRVTSSKGVGQGRLGWV